MAMEIKPKVFYSLKELDEGLGEISVFALREWIKNGRLKASKMGRAYIVLGQDLLDAIEKSSR
jgi:hypothetical protein